MTTLICAGGPWAGPRREESLLVDAVVRRALGAPVQRIRRFSRRQLADRQVAIEVRERDLSLQPKDVEGYHLLSRNTVAAVDYITVRCKNDVDIVSETVDRQRIAALARFRASLLAKDVRVRRLVQVGCTFEYQAQDWFRGFVLTLREGEGNLDNARLKFARDNEYAEGDVSAQVLAWNTPRTPPPHKFRSGSVRLLKRSPVRVEKTAYGRRFIFPGGSPLPTPTICGGRIFVSGGFSSRSYHALSARTLGPEWSIELSDNGPSAAACTQGRIYFNTESCTLFAVEARRGRHAWSHWLGDPLASMPSAHGDRAVTVYPAPFPDSPDPALKVGPESAAPTHVLASLDSKTGRFIWQRWIDAEAVSAPVIAGGRVAVTTVSGTVYVFAEKNGRLITAARHRAVGAPQFSSGSWFFPRRVEEAGARTPREGLSAIGQSPGLMGDSFSAAHLEARARAQSALAVLSLKLDRANGFYNGAPHAAHAEPAFVHLGLRTVSGIQFFEGARPLVLGDRFVSVFGNTVVAVRADGVRLWTLELPGDTLHEGGPLGSSPAYAASRIFVSTLAGAVLMIDENDGAVLRRFEAGEPLRSQPLIHGGRIYAPGTKGNLFVFETGEPTLTGWVAWGGNSGRTQASE